MKQIADRKSAPRRAFSDEELRAAAAELARRGRKGDSVLAFLNPGEADLLAALGGADSPHPDYPQAREFYGDSDPEGGANADRGEGDTSGGLAGEGVGGGVGAAGGTGAGTAAHRESEDRSMAVMDQMGIHGLGFGPLDGVIGGSLIGAGMRGMAGLRGMAERAGMDVKDTAPGTGEPEGGGSGQGGSAAGSGGDSNAGSASPAAAPQSPVLQVLRQIYRPYQGDPRKYGFGAPHRFIGDDQPASWQPYPQSGARA